MGESVSLIIAIISIILLFVKSHVVNRNYQRMVISWGWVPVYIHKKDGTVIKGYIPQSQYKILEDTAYNNFVVLVSPLRLGFFASVTKVNKSDIHEFYLLS